MSNSLDPKTIRKYFKDQKPPNLEELKKKGERFTDPYFQPTLNSIVGKDSNGNFVDTKIGQDKLDELEKDDPGSTTGKYTWKRITQIPGTWKVFEGEIEMEDIAQGLLGDCYFLTALSALSNYPYLIKSLFRTDEFNDMGYYEVILFIDGEWQVVFVDDYIVYYEGDEYEPFIPYAQPHNDELWTMILEKAWAKVNGGFALINGGLVRDALIALTGFPSIVYLHNPDKIDELFEKIEDGTVQNTIMSVGSRNLTAVKKRGIEKGHAYTILEGKSYEKDDSYLDLIKVRNPWGEGEWNGDWSDKSNKWTPELKKYFGFVDEDDGIFWISSNDYVANFASTSICYLLYGAMIKHFYFENEHFLKAPAVFNMHLKEASKVSISILFKDEKFNRTMHDATHPFSIVLCKYNDKKEIETFINKYDYKNNVEIVEDLDKGYYVIWLYCDYENIKNDNSFKYVMRLCSTKQNKVEFIGMDPNFYLIQKLITSYYKKKNEQIFSDSKKSIIVYDQKITQNGLNHFLYYNKSESEMWVVEASPVYFENINLFPPFRGLTNIKFKIPPGKAVAIIGMSPNGKAKLGYRNKHYLVLSNETQPELDVDSFLKVDLNENNTERKGLRTGSYKLVEKSQLKDIPVFTGIQEEQEKEKERKLLEDKIEKKKIYNLLFKEKFMDEATKKKEEEKKRLLQWEEEKEKVRQEKEAERIKQENSTVRTKEELILKYPREMALLEQHFKDADQSKDLQWKIITIERGTYAGQVQQNTEICDGTGIFFWKDSPYITIGQFKKGVTDGICLIMKSDLSLIYHGTIKEGKKEGEGMLVYERNEKGEPVEYYKGTFKNDKLQGFGVNHYKNGSEWIGTFNENEQNGYGLFVNGERYSITKYSNGAFTSEIVLTKEQIEKIKQAAKELKYKLFQEFYEINKKQQEQKDEACFIVQKMEHGVEEEKIDAKHREFLEKLNKAKTEEPFMVGKLYDLYNPDDPNKEEDFNEEHFVVMDLGEGKKYIGEYDNGKKNGKGAFFNGENYFIGYFKDDKPKGFIFKYNKDKVLICKGTFNENYEIQGKGTFYFNGNMFKGEISNGLPNGHGTMFFADGLEYVVGNFVQGKLEGEVTYYSSKGLLYKIVNYKDGKQIKEDEDKVHYQKEIEKDKEGIKILDKLSKEYPEVIKRLKKLPPAKIFDKQLTWGKKINKNGDIYIGQMAKGEDPFGRGCWIYATHRNVKYYIGALKHGAPHGSGCLYKEDWTLIFRGNFEYGERRGFGVQIKDGNYYGYFKTNNKSGLGVFENLDGLIYEGHFENGEKDGKGYNINYKDKTIEEITYREGNIEGIGEQETYNKKKQRKLMTQQISSIPKKYKKYIDMYLQLESKGNSLMASHGLKEDGESIYIGEMNKIGFMHGRGVLINNNTRTYYVGYFENNMKEGKGRIYQKNGFIQYEGSFHLDNPLGKGKYYFKDSYSTIEGVFDEVGEGEGIYTFEDGSYWKGNFFGWKKNGEGELFDEDGNSKGKKSYDLNRPL